MNIVSERTIENNAVHLEQLLNDLVLAFNNSRLSVLNRYNVSELDVEIIKFLVENENKKMKEVGDNFNIKLSTLTSTIDKLEKGKLVKAGLRPRNGVDGIDVTRNAKYVKGIPQKLPQPWTSRCHRRCAA